jgi:hypothetical protein
LPLESSSVPISIQTLSSYDPPIALGSEINLSLIALLAMGASAK